MRRGSRPVRRQSHLLNSSILNAARYSLDMMLLRHLNPIFKSEDSYTANVENLVEDLYNETKALVEDSTDEIRRNYTYLSVLEARTMLWHFDGNVHTCIEQLDKSAIKSTRLSRRICATDERTQVEQVVPKEFTCSVCFENQETEESGAISCGHSVCMSCVSSFLNVRIGDGDVNEDRLLCLSGDCSTEYNLYHLFLACTEDTFRKLLRFRLLRVVEVDARCRWCINPDCEAVMIGSYKNRRLECGTCGTVMCFKCSRAYHKGRCRKGTVEKGFKAWKRNKTNVKQCPQCKFAIEKTRGCNHMTCLKCHYQFCWLCLKKYSIDHFDGPYACPMMADHNPWGPNPAVRAVTKTVATLVVIPVGVIVAVVGAPVIVWMNREEIYESMRGVVRRPQPQQQPQNQLQRSRRRSSSPKSENVLVSRSSSTTTDGSSTTLSVDDDSADDDSEYEITETIDDEVYI